jgi:predicted ATPase
LLHQFRREGQLTQGLAEATITLATDQGFPNFLAIGTLFRGWALAEQAPLTGCQGQAQEAISQIRQGMASWQASGAEVRQASFRVLLSEAYEKTGQLEEGLSVLAEALDIVNKTGERYYEAELYRLKGALTLQQFKVQGSKFKVENSSESEAEECLKKAVEIARKQQAKSLELRATMSLARLWQQQGQHHDARDMLSEIYGWFTEGFDTKDLQEAKALLKELS